MGLFYMAKERVDSQFGFFYQEAELLMLASTH
jgi:hypothetical protein